MPILDCDVKAFVCVLGCPFDASCLGLISHELVELLEIFGVIFDGGCHPSVRTDPTSESGCVVGRGAEL